MTKAASVFITPPSDAPRLRFRAFPTAVSVLPLRSRRLIADEIERLIALLDQADGDPDLEPQCEDEGAQCDDEGVGDGH